MDLRQKKQAARARARKRGITVDEVANLLTGDGWHGAFVAPAPETTALRPVKAGKRLIRRAIEEVTARYPSLQVEQPTPEEYFVGHLWCVRVPGSADNFEELVTKRLRGMVAATKAPRSQATH